ncbi:MFS transporter [Azospirillum sp.]|uniref:MFS transporter n=1 Tax=Azospirillum sp. TaxID=34012 RepID=UPI002D6DB69C|nr:MFS transporter [Azospirillum sp.]HYF89532.1 MFS transporter [Azospirillum sp.]
MTADCLQDALPKTFGRQVVRKVTWRIVPFTFLLYVISYLDRANIGYAALQMNHELALGAEAFGFASGIFFIGYFLFEVPSNVMLARYGARVWIARILISWGIVSVLTAFVQTAEQLYVLRFLLGVAEAGFFPGIIVYLTHWFRTKEQATTIALFTAAIPVSYLMGAPLSTWMMDNINWLGLSGWRWMIILEGSPAILGGIATFLFLVDRPEQAKWLDTREKAWLVQELDADRKARANVRHLSTLRTMLNPKVLFLSLIYFVYQTGSLGIGYWMPQIIKGFSGTLSNTEVGLIAMVPYALATVGMIVWSHNSDRTGERRMHSALPLLLAGVALAAVGTVGTPWLAMALISAALTGLYAFKAPFWALPSLFLTRSTAAMSIAVINSIGNLGGFAGPYVIGLVKGATGSATAGLIFLSGLLVVSFLMTALMRLEERA